MPFLPFQELLAMVGIPWLIALSSPSLTPSSCGLLPVPLCVRSPFLFSYKDTSHWTEGSL